MNKFWLEQGHNDGIGQIEMGGTVKERKENKIWNWDI